MAEPALIVVSDATPLIGLAKIGQLRLLRDLFGRVVTPRAVLSEVIGQGDDRPGVTTLRQAEWLEVQTVTDHSRVDLLLSELNAGEAEAIVLAQEVAADWLLIDERRGRLIAQRLGLRVIGTLGILLLAKQSGVIGPIQPLLDRLRTERFYVSDRLYIQTLVAAGESDTNS